MITSCTIIAYHRLGGLEARQRRRRLRHTHKCVTNVCFLRRFHARNDITNLPQPYKLKIHVINSSHTQIVLYLTSIQGLDWVVRWRDQAQLMHTVLPPSRRSNNISPNMQCAINNTDDTNNTTILVEPGIKQEALQRSLARASWTRQALHHRRKYSRAAKTCFC